jgi:hypothetical protein
MKKSMQIGLLLVALVVPTMSFGAARTRRVLATCTGSTPCRACKNCRYCKHCAKDGGTCGVCRRRQSEQTQDSWEEASRRQASGRDARQ